MVMLLFFLSNNLFFFHLLGNFLYVVCSILWETVADDVILDFLCANLAQYIDRMCLQLSDYIPQHNAHPQQGGHRHGI